MIDGFIVRFLSTCLRKANEPNLPNIKLSVAPTQRQRNESHRDVNPEAEKGTRGNLKDLNPLGRRSVARNSTYPDAELHTRNPRDVTSALLAFWVGIGYLMERESSRCNRVEEMDYSNSHSLDEIQQRKMSLHVRILWECGISLVELATVCVAAKLDATWLYYMKENIVRKLACWRRLVENFKPIWRPTSFDSITDKPALKVSQLRAADKKTDRQTDRRTNGQTWRNYKGVLRYLHGLGSFEHDNVCLPPDTPNDKYVQYYFVNGSADDQSLENCASSPPDDQPSAGASIGHSYRASIGHSVPTSIKHSVRMSTEQDPSVYSQGNQPDPGRNVRETGWGLLIAGVIFYESRFAFMPLSGRLITRRVFLWPFS
ncbi:hypothetical protein EVAR_28544_1 [Eumeta japonica]|uniref:Uncharacterized protein n=1 Tax=Eumeta variegata TaxID=151549 RepID=A0A4C1UWT4_EUMVA|nr:hypothetical protein EVAR_28544_1 [Eumeta japonica]